MAGHSKWANVKYRKARVDAVKGKIFTKLSKEILMAARHGGSDMTNNISLRLAVQKARENNMPGDDIQRAIQKGTGELEGVIYEEIIYEGYGPGGFAIMLEILTDNRNRTAGEIRHIFAKNGGNLGETGCVSWMFKRRGYLIVNETDYDEDSLTLLALDAGAEDFVADDGTYEIFTLPEDFEKVKETLEGKGVTFSTAEVTMAPENLLEINEAEEARMSLGLIETLEDHDDVQNVYSNLDISQELMRVITDTL